MTAGDETALQLGVEVETIKKICLLLVSLIIGLVVAFSGLIGFVGLMVPHLARMAFGSDHRLLFPASLKTPATKSPVDKPAEMTGFKFPCSTLFSLFKRAVSYLPTGTGIFIQGLLK